MGSNISTSIWTTQHPNACENIQHSSTSNQVGIEINFDKKSWEKHPQMWLFLWVSDLNFAILNGVNLSCSEASKRQWHFYSYFKYDD